MKLHKQRHSKTSNDLIKDNSLSPNEAEKAKKVLGKLADHFTDDELKDIVSETRFLVETWLDDFEKQAFGGKTLQDLLYERNRT